MDESEFDREGLAGLCDVAAYGLCLWSTFVVFVFDAVVQEFLLIFIRIPLLSLISTDGNTGTILQGILQKEMIYGKCDWS